MGLIRFSDLHFHLRKGVCLVNEELLQNPCHVIMNLKPCCQTTSTSFYIVLFLCFSSFYFHLRSYGNVLNSEGTVMGSRSGPRRGTSFYPLGGTEPTPTAACRVRCRCLVTLYQSFLVPSRGAAGRLSGQERSVTFRGSGQTCPISPPVAHSQLYSVRGATDWGVR